VLARRVHQAHGVIDHRLHSFFRFLRRAVVINVEHVEEQQGGFFVVEMIDVHGFNVSFL
jgi:hypothetical protein